MKDKNIIKVLLVSPYSAKKVGGIGTWSKILLDYYDKSNQVNMIFLNTGTKLPKRWASGHRWSRVLVGVIDSMRIILSVIFQMIFQHPQVVHYTSSASLALRKGLIVIGIVRNLFHKKIIIHWHFGRIPAIFEEKGTEYKLFVKACRKTNMSIAIDERSYNVLQQEGINSVYVPNPIPIQLQQMAESLNEGCLFDNRNEGEVLFVGHVVKGKGIVELVDACARCESVKRLIVVGPFFETQIKETITSLAKKRDNGAWLHIVGEKNREEVWNYYKTCSVFCLPSYSEGFPYVILEAMSFACPIIASNVGAIPEMLSDGCGEVVEPQDTASLQRAISNMLTDSEMRKRTGEKARMRVLNNYTVKRVAQQYYKLWLG